jgi:hypothetical protein
LSCFGSEKGKALQNCSQWGCFIIAQAEVKTKRSLNSPVLRFNGILAGQKPPHKQTRPQGRKNNAAPELYGAKQGGR